jgi:hypothetical protein
MARIETDPNYSSPTFSRATAATDIFKKEDVQALAAAMSTHDHSAGKGLLLSAASIQDGSIGTADLAANAVTQSATASGVTSGPTTTSSVFADIPDMSITLTTTGGNVLVWLMTLLQNSGVANATTQLALRADSGADVSSLTQSEFKAVGSNIVGSTLALFSGLSAGAHTFRGRWSTNAGTLLAPLTQRYMVAVELKK